MKQFQVVNSYNSTNDLINNENLSVADQWNLYKLRKELRSYKEFYEERVEAVRQKYAPKVVDNMLYGKDADDFKSEIAELDNMDVDVSEVHKIELKLQQGITVKTIEAVEDFIDFKMEEE